MNRARFRAAALGAAVLGSLSGCRGCEREVLPPASPTASPSASPSASPIMSIAPEVALRWAAVTVAVLGSGGTSSLVRLELGGAAAPVVDSPLAIELMAFAPNFRMDAATQDVRSDADPANPAARLRVTERGKTVFEGWVFPFDGIDEWNDDPRYDLKLTAWHPRSAAP